jgi:hypothetical protein
MSGCWLWLGMIDKDGYGSFPITRKEAAAKGHTGRQRRAHRASYEMHVGPIPDGLCVLHRCDNRACVNPAHLYVGTDADNVADMHARGRARPTGAPGPRHPKAKLTPDDVIAIRSIYRSNVVTQREIGIAFGIVQAYVSRILRGDHWSLRAA